MSFWTSFWTAVWNINLLQFITLITDEKRYVFILLKLQQTELKKHIDLDQKQLKSFSYYKTLD